MKKVYIILLNYNGWKDTLECLESVLKLECPGYQVVVVDNDSPNRSMDHMLSWAKGDTSAMVVNEQLKELSTPHCTKPIDFVLYNNAQALAGGDLELESRYSNPVIFIQSGDNKGFAAGNNLGIEYVLKKNDADFVWLLNNDTVIDPGALSALLEKAQEYSRSDQKVGIIGAKLMFYDMPAIIQGVGGVYNKWLSISRHIGGSEKDIGQYNNNKVSEVMDYPIGASMFVSINFIKNIGLMCEDFFLYYEEMDWVLRGRKKGWKIGYCWKSKVFHKEGGSIGTSSVAKDKSKLADYYGLRNRIVFTRKQFPKYIVPVLLGFFIVVFNRVRRMEFDRLGLVYRAIFDK